MRDDRITILNDTLSVIEKGSYEVEGKTVLLKLSKEQMKEARVFLPEDIKKIDDYKNFTHVHVLGRCWYGCENEDSFSLAIRKTKENSRELQHTDAKPVLVLNLANPINPGGGVRRGAKAQEEDLCRRSSLLLSLEGKNASLYYDYNRALDTYMGSDAIIIHPQVEIIKDENGVFLDESVIVAVMTCAAPMLTYGMEGMSQQQYEDLLFNRITGMLKVAAYCGYKRLVLGAFGCGAFQNDAKVVSDLFYKALKQFDFDGMKEYDMFRSVDFAVLSRSKDQYNYKEFARNFDDFYRDETQREINAVLTRIKESEVYLDAIRGCIYGGAVGDALGYPVEFYKEDSIFSKYGKRGITEFEKDPVSGKALISDDTQMTLFTATGLLIGDTRGNLRGIRGEPRTYVFKAYQDWLRTQNTVFHKRTRKPDDYDMDGFSWLLDVPELYSRRAPGNTCLSALEEGTEYEDYIEAKRNRSKGCGGVMRIAPVAVDYQGIGMETLDLEAAQIAAITHGHPLGYIPAAVLVHIINRIVFPPEGKIAELTDIVQEAMQTAVKIFSDDQDVKYLTDLINLAISLAKSDTDDLENIHKLGEGWVAEETLAIAIYCAIKYQNDFEAGVVAAVNHNGDSDSTGAVTGNILGALLGYSAIPDKWKHDLELSDVILEIADDLCHGCQMEEYSSYQDDDWVDKYVYMRRPVENREEEPRQQSAVFFWRDTEKNGYFSNWYRRKFVIDDFEYLHVEQYMMAQKAKLFHDSERYTAILKTDDPSKCKALGKKVTPFDSKVWDANKKEIVKTGNRAKFEQNPDLKAILIETGDAILAEASPRDKIWGIGIGEKAAAAKDPSEWPGENLLGKILMELRDEFRRVK